MTHVGGGFMTQNIVFFIHAGQCFVECDLSSVV